MILSFIFTSLKNQAIKLFLLNVILFSSICSLLCLNYYFSSKKENQIIQHQKSSSLTKIIFEAKERLLFLEKIIPETDEKKVYSIIQNVKPITGVASDIFIIRDNYKYSSSGKINVIKIYQQYKKTGIFQDSFGNICFSITKKGDFYVLRISSSSLAKFLDLHSQDDILFPAKRSGSEEIFVLGFRGLMIKERKDQFFRQFLDKYSSSLIIIELIIIIIMAVYFLFYICIYHVLKSKNKAYNKKVGKELKKLQTEISNLKQENKNRERLAYSLRTRHKIQIELCNELKKRQKEIYKDIFNLVSSYCFKNISFFEKDGMFKLQNDLLEKLRISADNLFIIQREEVSLRKVIETAEKYVSWNLLKSEVILTHSLKEEDSFIQSDEFGLKILFINLLVSLIGCTYKGREISINIYNETNGPSIFVLISEKPISVKPHLNREDLSNPLILEEEVLFELSKQLGFCLKKINIDGFGYKINMLEIKDKLSNVIKISR